VVSWSSEKNHGLSHTKFTVPAAIVVSRERISSFNCVSELRQAAD
jgi:hypothetical protein